MGKDFIKWENGGDSLLSWGGWSDKVMDVQNFIGYHYSLYNKLEADL